MFSANDFIDSLEDKTIFSIENDADGNKMIHFLGYGYYSEDISERPYRMVEYCGFIVPIEWVLEDGFYNYESEHEDEHKQYIEDCDYTTMVDRYLHYDAGNAPMVISHKELSTETPLGVYIMRDA